jgi:hypothetical protein
VKGLAVAFWLLVLVSIPSYLFYMAGWEDGSRSASPALRALQQELEISTAISENCDRALVSCQGWQARVGMGLDNVERACVTSDVIRERLKVLLERNNRAKNQQRPR